jgi:hypothetical protein
MESNPVVGGSSSSSLWAGEGCGADSGCGEGGDSFCCACLVAAHPAVVVMAGIGAGVAAGVAAAPPRRLWPGRHDWLRSRGGLSRSMRAGW